ncbi:MAG: DNA-processing protein DprA [Spirochaetaceae bacterium]|nr:DNA-processing protein DprA [Spirochaetaceae bacterium]
MNCENKRLVSLLPYSVEKLKIKMLKENFSYREIMNTHRLYKSINISSRLSALKKFNMSFIDEMDYPKNLLNCDIPPFRLSSTAGFPNNEYMKFGIIGSRYAYNDVLTNLYNFSSSMAREDCEIIGTGGGTFYYTLERAMEYNGGRSFVLSSSGINSLSFVKDNYYSTILSIFEPNEKPTRKNFSQMYEIFATLCDCVIMFQCSDLDDCRRSITPTLDSGKSIYVHKSCVNDRIGCERSLSLYNDGCLAISNFNDLVSEENLEYGTSELKNIK